LYLELKKFERLANCQAATNDPSILIRMRVVEWWCTDDLSPAKFVTSYRANSIDDIDGNYGPRGRQALGAFLSAPLLASLFHRLNAV